jgi:hypothetical protein
MFDSDYLCRAKPVTGFPGTAIIVLFFKKITYIHLTCLGVL